MCKTKKDTNMFQADSTQLKLLIYYINTVTAGSKVHNTRQNNTSLVSNQRHLLAKSCNK